MTLYWFSFADDSGFLGGCIAQGLSFPDAHAETHVRGCNPGGEVQAMELTDDDSDDVRLADGVQEPLGRVWSHKCAWPRGTFEER